MSSSLLTGGAGLSEDLGTESLTQSAWSEAVRRFRRDKFAMGGLVLALILCILAVLAPVISMLVGHGPNQLFPSELNSFGLPAGPSIKFLMGVDQQGRDLLVRCLYGLGTSLSVSLLATAIGTSIGVAAGLLAGYFGGWIDTVVGRWADVFLAVPLVLVAISISSVCSVSASGCLDGAVQPGIGLVVLILTLAGWPYIARIVRGQTLMICNQEFVPAARAMGASHFQVMFLEILPNLLVQIIVYAALLIPTNVIFEATLSYLGVGIPPTTPSLGGILSDATAGGLFTYAWWMMAFPGAFLILITISFNVVGDGVRDALGTS
ncbi:MAG: ABC transporter permease [Candidatus Dormibacteria bacterium]